MTTTMRKFIYVKFQREGIHRYPDAAINPKLQDVAFLGNDHRHIFHFKVTISVEHNDREIEFIQFKRWLESLYTDDVLQLDFKSCEMLAEALIDKISDRYPNRVYMVDVSEDNENGALLVKE